jgi:hypothetical protein
MKKLYCYVDETGQDTSGRFFLVAAVMIDLEREPIVTLLEEVEQDSSKGRVKWAKSNLERQTAYIKRVLALPEFQGRLYFATYRDSTDYPALTMQTSMWVIQTHVKDDECSTTVIVDGLTKDGYQAFTNYLRQQGHISRCKVRGATDDNDALIRLADALAGFARGALEGKKAYKRLWAKALRDQHIIEVKQK